MATHLARSEAPPTAKLIAAAQPQLAGANHSSDIAESAAKPEQHVARSKRLARWTLGFVVVGMAVASCWHYAPVIKTALTTISTDDAYVNGHVTLVAPRVSGQVAKVMVDDNYRVRKGDVLVRLDRVPYEVAAKIRRAAVGVAEANLTEANAGARAAVGQLRAARYRLDNAIQEVDGRIAQLAAIVATLHSREADLQLARNNLRRGERLVPTGAISEEQFERYQQATQVAEARAEEALQAIYAQRVSLGLPAKTEDQKALATTPDGLDQSFSAVRESLAELVESAAQLGYHPSSLQLTPRQVIEEFNRQDPEGNLDHIYATLVANAPGVEQAKAQLEKARRDLDQAELDLSYCDVVSEIDGVVTSRNVNPGTNVQAGQSLMAVRSVHEVWIDANFKETQLADMRIGQRVTFDVDMYGGRRQFEGRVSGFTMGTGQTLALLPPENATGNFVKIVQRLPVRIELVDYYPDVAPLFVGLSVTPHVHYREPAAGPNAGNFLQAAGKSSTIEGGTEL